MKFVAVFLFILLSFSEQGEALAARRRPQREAEQRIVVDGRERTYQVHVPPGYDGRSKAPLVILFHGGGGDAGQAAGTYRMNPVADRHGFLVVYPNGTGPLPRKLLTWNSGNCCGYAQDNAVDDVAFVRALVAKLRRDYSIDDRRIYATGISNGGMMAYRVACQMPETFAAIAPVAGALNVQCEPRQPVSVIIFHGTADLHVPYEGGVGPLSRDGRKDASVSYAVDFWTGTNSCARPPKHTVNASGRIFKDSYLCASGIGVDLVTIRDGGHAWPGGELPRVRFMDEPTQEISASELMWDFFQAHPKRR